MDLNMYATGTCCFHYMVAKNNRLIIVRMRNLLLVSSHELLSFTHKHAVTTDIGLRVLSLDKSYPLQVSRVG